VAPGQWQWLHLDDDADQKDGPWKEGRPAHGTGRWHRDTADE
jgi:hypothetical protein